MSSKSKNKRSPAKKPKSQEHSEPLEHTLSPHVHIPVNALSNADIAHPEPSSGAVDFVSLVMSNAEFENQPKNVLPNQDATDSDGDGFRELLIRERKHQDKVLLSELRDDTKQLDLTRSTLPPQEDSDLHSVAEEIVEPIEALDIAALSAVNDDHAFSNSRPMVHVDVELPAASVGMDVPAGVTGSPSKPNATTRNSKSSGAASSSNHDSNAASNSSGAASSSNHDSSAPLKSEYRFSLEQPLPASSKLAGAPAITFALDHANRLDVTSLSTAMKSIIQSQIYLTSTLIDPAHRSFQQQLEGRMVLHGLQPSRSLPRLVHVLVPRDKVDSNSDPRDNSIQFKSHWSIPSRSDGNCVPASFLQSSNFEASIDPSTMFPRPSDRVGDFRKQVAQFIRDNAHTAAPRVLDICTALGIEKNDFQQMREKAAAFEALDTHVKLDFLGIVALMEKKAIAVATFEAPLSEMTFVQPHSYFYDSPMGLLKLTRNMTYSPTPGQKVYQMFDIDDVNSVTVAFYHQASITKHGFPSPEDVGHAEPLVRAPKYDLHMFNNPLSSLNPVAMTPLVFMPLPRIFATPYLSFRRDGESHHLRTGDVFSTVRDEGSTSPSVQYIVLTTHTELTSTAFKATQANVRKKVEEMNSMYDDDSEQQATQQRFQTAHHAFESVEHSFATASSTDLSNFSELHTLEGFVVAVQYTPTDDTEPLGSHSSLSVREFLCSLNDPSNLAIFSLAQIDALSIKHCTLPPNTAESNRPAALLHLPNCKFDDPRLFQLSNDATLDSRLIEHGIPLDFDCITSKTLDAIVTLLLQRMKPELDRRSITLESSVANLFALFLASVKADTLPSPSFPDHLRLVRALVDANDEHVLDSQQYRLFTALMYQQPPLKRARAMVHVAESQHSSIASQKTGPMDSADGGGIATRSRLKSKESSDDTTNDPYSSFISLIEIPTGRLSGLSKAKKKEFEKLKEKATVASKAYLAAIPTASTKSWSQCSTDLRKKMDVVALSAGNACLVVNEVQSVNSSKVTYSHLRKAITGIAEDSKTNPFVAFFRSHVRTTPKTNTSTIACYLSVCLARLDPQLFLAFWFFDYSEQLMAQMISHHEWRDMWPFTLFKKPSTETLSLSHDFTPPTQFSERSPNPTSNPMDINSDEDETDEDYSDRDEEQDEDESKDVDMTAGPAHSKKRKAKEQTDPQQNSNKKPKSKSQASSSEPIIDLTLSHMSDRERRAQLRNGGSSSIPTQSPSGPRSSPSPAPQSESRSATSRRTPTSAETRPVPLPATTLPTTAILVPSIPVPSIPVPSIPVPSIPAPSNPLSSNLVPGSSNPSDEGRLLQGQMAQLQARIDSYVAQQVSSTPVPSIPVPSIPVSSNPVPGSSNPSDEGRLLQAQMAQLQARIDSYVAQQQQSRAVPTQHSDAYQPPSFWNSSVPSLPATSLPLLPTPSLRIPSPSLSPSNPIGFNSYWNSSAMQLQNFNNARLAQLAGSLDQLQRFTEFTNNLMLFGGSAMSLHPSQLYPR